MIRTGAILLALTAALAAAPTGAAEPPSTFSAAQVRQILRDKVQRDRRAVGVVVGVIDENGSRVFVEGSPCVPGQGSLNGDTVFEIGSLTKPFTAALLAGLSAEGRLDPDTPVARLLPEGVSVPSRGGRAITLRHLADHTSGLPRMPTNFTDERSYGVPALYDFLKTYELPRDPGETREYSNIGYGLLGHALARHGGVSYEALLAARLTRPLGMRSTFVTPPPSLEPRRACGHDEALKPLPATRLAETLQAGGGVSSTANDLLRFLSASMGLGGGSRPVWGRAQQVHGYPLVGHDGSTTSGFSSYMAYDPARRRAVVLLSNSRYLLSDVALHLLQPAYPLVPRRTAVRLPRAVLEQRAGVYALSDQDKVVVAPYRDRLFMQRAGQPPRELFAESPTGFFLDEARPVTFSETGAGGVLTLFQRDGLSVAASRTGERPTPIFQELELSLLDRRTGRYRMADGDVLEVTRAGDRLFARLAGQDALEILPLTDTRFTYMVVSAEIVFTAAGEGPSPRLELVQNGVRTPALREGAS